MKVKVLGSVSTLCATLLLSSFQHAHGDVTINWTLGGGFNPSNPSINPGEYAYWHNADGSFDVMITVQGFYPFVLYPGETAGAQFPSAGTYTMESDWGDSGLLTVGTIIPPPTATITTPTNGAVLPANTPFNIQVEVTAEAGISYVEFWVENLTDYNWALIGDVYSAPFAVTTNLTEGSYNLHVYATDNNYQTGMDTIAITVVAAPPTPIRLGSARRVGGQFIFDVTGLMVGRTNVVECCTNLSVGTWFPVATNIATSTSTSVTNAVTAMPRFYRIHQMP